jgi:hypothetical protein
MNGRLCRRHVPVQVAVRQDVGLVVIRAPVIAVGEVVRFPEVHSAAERLADDGAALLCGELDPGHSAPAVKEGGRRRPCPKP